MKKAIAITLRSMSAVSFALAFVMFLVTFKGTLGEIKAPKDFN